MSEIICIARIRASYVQNVGDKTEHIRSSSASKGGGKNG